MAMIENLNKRIWTPEEVEAMTSMRARGMLAADIAKALGRTVGAVTVRASNLGLPHVKHQTRKRSGRFAPADARNDFPGRLSPEEEEAAALDAIRALIGPDRKVTRQALLDRLWWSSWVLEDVTKRLRDRGTILFAYRRVDESRVPPEDVVESTLRRIGVDPLYGEIMPSQQLRAAALSSAHHDPSDDRYCGVATPRYNRPVETPDEERARVLGEIRGEVARCRKLAIRHGWRPRPRKQLKTKAA